MKKTTQKLFKLSLEKLNYEDNKIIFGNYEIIHDYPRIIKKDGNQIWVVVNWEVYINSFFERFLFWRQVEKNLSNITEFFKKYLWRMWTEKAELQEKVDHFKNKISELEDKLAQSVANNIDLDTNRKA